MLSHILSTFKKLTFVLLLLLCSIQANASHVVGADIYYTYVSGLTYKITVVLYGDCGPASAAVFSTLPSGRPVVCVLAGSTSVTTLNLNIENPSAGVEITPVCAADSAHTQCTNTSYSIPGIKRFVYSINYTLPYTAPNWKFLFKGAYGSASAGRAAAITNITGSSTIEIACCNLSRDSI